jgi:hypothetical protein
MLKFSAQIPTRRVVRLPLPTALIAATAVTLLAAPGALADTSVSSNWSGYAVHRSGVRFREVKAAWRQPTATCAAGSQSYSAAWVGLGGYSENSNALEQIGTEVDCSASGHVISSAWYELVPAPSEDINLRVRPGDDMAASVTVVGHHVTVSLEDATRHRSFTKSFDAGSIDITSAEWIVEAPSDCVGANSCTTLPLADFGTTSFALASARTTTGHSGTITSRYWGRTAITLSPSGRRFIAYQGSGPAAGAATPSALLLGGSAFSVTYQQVAPQGNPFFARRGAAAAAGYLVHPGR